MDCKITTFCINLPYFAFLLIVNFLRNLHFVKFATWFAFSMLTV